MSQLEEEARPMPAGDQPVYVYGIVRQRHDGKDLPPLHGIAAEPVRAVNGEGLAALVGTLAEFSLEDVLKNPAQAERMILAHHGLLQSLSDDRTVLPTRFGTLFSSDSRVRDALHEHRQALLAALDRLEGAREWGVKMFCDQSVLRGHLGETSPAMLATQEKLVAATQGRAFFLQRQMARLKQEETGHAVTMNVDESRRRLSEAARAEAVLKLQPAAVHGRADDMVWNGAYLVANSDADHFFTQIDQLRQVLAPRGFLLEANGPWPPFSFADHRLREQE